jgi:hypothetical protein
VLGNEHLAAMSRRGDPRGAMHVNPEVVRVGNERLPRVNAHPDANRGIPGPAMRGELGLDVARRRDGRGRLGKGEEEAVPLRVDLHSSMPRHELADDSPVCRDDPWIRRTELVEQASRTLDIGEEERDGARGQTVPHRSSEQHFPASNNCQLGRVFARAPRPAGMHLEGLSNWSR